MHGSLPGILAIFALLLSPANALAQSLTAQNGATVVVERELDVPGDLIESGGGTFSFARDAALTLSGSSQQTVDPAVTVADLTLNNPNGAALEAAVDVTGTLTLTDGTLTTNGNLTLASTSETSTAAIAGTGIGSVNGNVTFERYLYKSDGASHYRRLSAPTETLLDDADGGSESTFEGAPLLSNTWTQSGASSGDTGANVNDPDNPSVFTYNESETLGGGSLSAGWEPVEQFNSNEGDFSPGEGFLAWLFDDRDFDGTDDGFPRTLSATGEVQEEENGSGGAVDLSGQITYTDNDSQSEDGWNLIANPFMAPIDWESIENDRNDLNNVTGTIYVYDAANGSAAIYQADDNGTDGTKSGTRTQGRYIAPFQAFFVKATGSNPDIGGIDSGDKAIGQNPSMKSTPPGDESPQVTLLLRAEGDSVGEATVLQYGQDAAPGRDAYDAYQLRTPAAGYALVASEMAGMEALFDIQSRPVPTAQDTVDLALDITESGTYTLGTDTLAEMPSDWRVILKNLDSGAHYDLSAGETVSFDHTASASTKTSASTSAEAMLRKGRLTVASAESSGSLPSFRVFVGPEAALPAEITQFEAQAEDGEVRLQWQTASETNDAGFAVERRVSSTSREAGAEEKEGTGGWVQVGFVEGGPTTKPNYRFTDEDLPFEAEQVTYRLRRGDLGGSMTQGEEVTVQLGAPSEARLHAPFPNPARQRATLRYEIPEGHQGTGVRIDLYDMLGRRVRTLTSGAAEAGRHERQLDLQSLSAGSYFLRLQAGTTTRTQQLTIVR